MEPMKPMKPMEPMQPMTPMAPMKDMDPWWPKGLGDPSTSGGQNDMRYAVFPDKRRLLVQEGGATKTYDTADHKISGVSQQQSGSHSLTFSSQDGPVDLASLKQV